MKDTNHSRIIKKIQDLNPFLKTRGFQKAVKNYFISTYLSDYDQCEDEWKQLKETTFSKFCRIVPDVWFLNEEFDGLLAIEVEDYSLITWDKLVGYSYFWNWLDDEGVLDFELITINRDGVGQFVELQDYYFAWPITCKDRFPVLKKSPDTFNALERAIPLNYRYHEIED